MKSKLAVLPWLILLLPFDLIVAIGLLFAELCVRTFPSSQSRGGAKQRARSASAVARSPNSGQFGDASTAAIVIANWDGKHLLAECLPSVVEAITHAGGNHEILVVDNGSTDGSVQFLKGYFPQVRLLALNRNHGFGGGNNLGVEAVQTDIVVFLNNDMVVDHDFLPPLLAGFEDPSVFAVTSQIFFSDPARPRQETGKTRARFEKGLFYFWHEEIQPDDENLKTIPVFWAGGGSCAVDRRKFLALGGFDPLYAPFYLEDTDISYQAWKHGWKCLLAPASRVVHKHRSTSRSKFGERFVENTIRRNGYLFIWKNVTGAALVFEHIVNLPRLHLRSMIQNGSWFEFKAFLRALLRLPIALTKRVANTPGYTMSDREAVGLTGFYR